MKASLTSESLKNWTESLMSRSIIWFQTLNIALVCLRVAITSFFNVTTLNKITGTLTTTNLPPICPHLPQINCLSLLNTGRDSTYLEQLIEKTCNKHRMAVTCPCLLFKNTSSSSIVLPLEQIWQPRLVSLTLRAGKLLSRHSWASTTRRNGTISSSVRLALSMRTLWITLRISLLPSAIQLTLSASARLRLKQAQIPYKRVTRVLPLSITFSSPSWWTWPATSSLCSMCSRVWLRPARLVITAQSRKEWARYLNSWQTSMPISLVSLCCLHKGMIFLVMVIKTLKLVLPPLDYRTFVQWDL